MKNDQRGTDERRLRAMVPRTKLVCTIGPASIDRLDDLVRAGMSVARVNFAHGGPSDHAAIVREVRRAAEEAKRDVAVLADLPGPKIRLGEFDRGEVSLAAGTTFRIGPTEVGDARGVASNHPLAEDLLPGDRVLLADGAAELRVTGSTGETLETTVERGGRIRSRAGVAVPAERLSLPALTADDRAALPRAIDLGIDFIGLSFVRSARDVTTLREALAAIRPVGAPAIVAKIETRPADALMVARGDLGVELPFEEVPLIQKRLVRSALAAGRPVIVATQMLESMTSVPRPTRAEASDVANAALEGVDAVMLSAETAIGDYPIEAADAAIRILAAADAGPSRGPAPAAVMEGTIAADDASAVASAAIQLAHNDADVRLLACFTRTGRTAMLLAAMRPRVPILAFSPDPAVRRRLALSHGVEARPIDDVDDADIPTTLSHAVASSGDAGAVVMVATTAGGGSGPNLIELVRPAAGAENSSGRG